MDRQLQKVIDPSGLEITKGTRVTDGEWEGFVQNIFEASIDYSDEAQRPVMYCPKVIVHVQPKQGQIRKVRDLQEIYNTHWDEEIDESSARAMGKMITFVCDDLEVIE